MRAIVTRVSQAGVSVDSEITGEIKSGLMVFIGFTDGDDETTTKKMAQKIARLRIFEDDAGKMNLNIQQTGGEVLSVPQFTLYADLSRGNRPSFFRAMEKEEASRLYHFFNDCLERDYHLNVGKGKFGVHMDVGSINDGPVTIVVDSDDF